MFFVHLHHPSTINHSVNTHKQVAGSRLPTRSHSPIVWDRTACDYIQHPCLPRGFSENWRQTVILRQGALTRGHPSQGTPLHRSLFMLMFIMVQSNPCLVNYTRAAICQHLAGGLQGSKQQIGCTEPTM